MRVIIAARLSQKVSDRNQYGLDTQEQHVVDWASRNGHKVVAVCADYKSGRSDMMKRKNLRPWVEDPEKLGQYEAIVALKLDRLTRGNAAENRRLEDWADDHGKKLIIVDGPVFPCEGADGVIWDVLKRQAHAEWLSIQERYSRSATEIKARGSWYGKPPYGYSVHKTATGKTIIPDDHAGIVRSIFNDAAAGVPLNRIASTLTADGIKPPKASWSVTGITRMIKNRTYLGSNANNPNLTWQPLISQETWQQANSVISSHKPASPRGHDRSLLIPQCMQCGGKMYRIYIGGNRSGSARQPWYRCQNVCGARMIPCGLLDNEISELWSVDDSPDTIKIYHPAETKDLDALEKRHRDATAARNWKLAANVAQELEEASQDAMRAAWTEDKPTGMSKAQAWASLDADGRAAKMRGYTVTVRRMEDGNVEWSMTARR